MAGQRIQSLDVLKGIGILLVIAGHSGMPKLLTSIIYSFHIPLFFLISGFLFHEQDMPLIKYIKKCASRYIYPYLLTCFILIVLQILSLAHYKFGLQGLLVASLWGKSTMNVPYSNAMFADIPLIGAIWFLLALFWAEIIYWISNKINHGWVFILFCFCGGIYSFKYIYMPFSIQSGMVASLWVWCGSLYKKKRDRIDVAMKNTHPIFSFPALILLWILCVMYGDVNIAICSFRNIPIAVVGSISIVYLLFYTLENYSSKLMNNSILIKIGTLTLFIMCMHVIELDGLRFGHYLKHLAQTFPLLDNKFILLGILCPAYVLYIYVTFKIFSKISITNYIYHLK